ncbi:MAG TPA: DUF3857 domain-containing protein [Thermoanaerobaculia bacterium]|jgi:transglutaminase-like putative cysteine protease|nr:DUF3857 domain-containing protein [Thermoanaerobaculia bacterium]
MPKPSSSSAGRPRRLAPTALLLPIAAILGIVATPTTPAHAATVLERSVAVEVRPDGSMRTTEKLRVRLEAAEDFAAWSPYPLAYDENAKIERLEARTVKPDGQVVEAGRKAIDTAEVSSAGVLHSGVKVRSVTFPAAPVGSTLEVESVLSEQPYYPGSRIDLSPGRDRVTALSVEVRGAGPGFRFHVSGPAAGLQIEPLAGGVRITGHDLPADRTLDSTPTDPGPTLRFAWGGASDWVGVAAWWADLLRSVPRGTPEVRAEADRIVRGLGGAPSKQEKLAALIRYAQRDVRYVAIEVGFGGYRPHAPAESIGKKYGDCKDKAVLLVDLLAAAGLEAYPVLIRLDRTGRIDRDFPSPFDFNHAIVALPVAGPNQAIDLPPSAPVAGGYLFVDATQEIGASLVWLAPHVQDQDALIVRGDQGKDSVLVRTPTLPTGEARTLTIDLSVASTPEPATGDAQGQARLDLSGWQAAWLVETLADKQPNEIDTTLRGIFADLFPGATLGRLTWQPEREGLPHATATAQIVLPGLLGNASRSFQAISLSATPSSGVLDNRATNPIPVVLSPGTAKTIWRFHLPEAACKLEPQDTMTENALGSFRQTLRFEDGLAILERTAETRSRFVEPADFPAFKELSLAEHRAEKKRVRLGCGG